MQELLRTNMHNFQERLKEARETLGLSQQALAERLGVSLRSQQNYEAGIRQPDATYLAALAAAGADVLYILTDQRMSKVQRQQLAVTAKTVLEMEPNGGPLTERLKSAYKKHGTDRVSAEYVELLEVLDYCKPADLELLKAVAVWIAKR